MMLGGLNGAEVGAADPRFGGQGVLRQPLHFSQGGDGKPEFQEAVPVFV